MPKPEEWPTAAGFRTDGPILSGAVTPELARATEIAKVTRQQIASHVAAGTKPGYVPPEDYDPVLRFHCRLGKAHY